MGKSENIRDRSGRKKTRKVHSDLAAVRLRAWETRRKKYGPRGHGSSYSRASAPPSASAGMLALLIDLHLSAVVSEGQLAKATALDRIEVRRLVDEHRLRTGREYAA